MHWLSENKDWLLAILQLVPWRELVLGMFAGGFCGLLAGLLLSTLLHKAGLFRRNTRWLNIAVKIYWGFIPAVFIFAGLQIAAVRSAWRTADNIIVANEAPIREHTRAFLGTVQTQLDTLIRQSPSLKDTSLDNLIDTAIEQSLAQLPETEKTSITTQPATYALAWFKSTLRSTLVRKLLKRTLVKAAQKVSGADKTSVEMVFQKTLGQMADDNIAYAFARERLRKLLWGFITAALIHTLPFLLIPAVETALSKWRKW